MNRFDYLHKTYRLAQERARKERILMMTRSEPNRNANGTSGYAVKNGTNQGMVLAHRTVRSTNNWQQNLGVYSQAPNINMKHKKQKHPAQSPWEIRKQIIEQLKRERDPVEQESLKQRLHHYNTVCSKN